MEPQAVPMAEVREKLVHSMRAARPLNAVRGLSRKAR